MVLKQIPRFVCRSRERLSAFIYSHDSLKSLHTEKSESDMNVRKSSTTAISGIYAPSISIRWISSWKSAALYDFFTSHWSHLPLWMPSSFKPIRSLGTICSRTMFISRITFSTISTASFGIKAESSKGSIICPAVLPCIFEGQRKRFHADHPRICGTIIYRLSGKSADKRRGHDLRYKRGYPYYGLPRGIPLWPYGRFTRYKIHPSRMDMIYEMPFDINIYQYL